MNARRTLVILGTVAVVLLAAVVALAVFFHYQMEKEKNQAKTAPARRAKLENISKEKEAVVNQGSDVAPETTEFQDLAMMQSA